MAQSQFLAPERDIETCIKQCVINLDTNVQGRVPCTNRESEIVYSLIVYYNLLQPIFIISIFCTW